MSNPRAPARERFYGPMYGDGMAQSVPHIQGENPETVERMRRNYGRYLAGFDGESMSGQVGYDPRYQGQEVYDLEKEDDTYGSGIFDPKGRGGTSNADMGVFASHDSLPGYVARQVPFTVSRDVTDITDNADVVSVPGGGMAYVERRGRLSGAAITGPTWRPAQIEPAGHTRFDQVYADMSPPGRDGHYLNAQAPDRKIVPALRPGRRLRRVQQVPGYPYERSVPSVPRMTGVPKRSIVSGRQVPVPITAAAAPVAAAAPDLPMGPAVPFRQTVNVAPAGPPLPVSGYGAYGTEPDILECAEGEAVDMQTGKCVPACPEGEYLDIESGKCAPSKAAAKADDDWLPLAIGGAVAGLAVGLLIYSRSKKI